MKTIVRSIPQIFYNRQGILLFLSLISGLIAISDEIEEGLEFWQKGITYSLDSLILLSGQLLVFTCFSHILLQTFVCWRPRTQIHIKHLLMGIGVTSLFIALVKIFISPLIEYVNSKIHTNNTLFFHTNIHDNPYHEPFQAWSNDLIFLFLVTYTLSRIYLLYIHKREIEHNYSLLKNESLQSRIEALRNQINPHFFFNSLNSLYALVDEGDKKKSLEYISNMSAVFRYILQSEKHNLVPLKDELHFLKEYIDMLDVKYGTRLTFDISIPDEAKTSLLPVLSLLPLIENAIKHNEISSRHPMKILIFLQSGHLVIENFKQPKLDVIEKSGIGLTNLSNRFNILANKPIEIQDTDEIFRVLLPLTQKK